MENETRKGDWIQTHSGIRFYPLDPQPGDILLSDIIHALSNLCRYGGHASVFYSVAEHCVILADFMYEKTGDPKLAMAALLHDAAEAYILDLPRPIKHMLPDYMAMEENIERVIFELFNVSKEDLEQVKECDRAILMDEREALFDDPLPWGTDCAPLGVTLRCLSPEDARANFIRAYTTYRLKIMNL